MQYKVKLATRRPHSPDLLVRQDTIPLDLFTGSFDLEARIVVEKLTTDGPIEDPTHQPQRSVGHNGRSTLHDLVEEGEDIAAADIIGLALSPLRKHICGEEPRIFPPALFVDFSIEVEVLRRDVGHRRCRPDALFMCGRITTRGHGMTSVEACSRASARLSTG